METFAETGKKHLALEDWNMFVMRDLDSYIF